MPQKKSTSLAVIKDEELKKNQDTLILTEEQQKRFNLDMQRLKDAKEQRDQHYEEFDDQTYEMDYYTNKRAANAYLHAKRNDDEIRINTGTTEKKIEVVSNELMALNLQPDAQVFDSNENELRNLGRDFIDIVNRTNQIEKDDDFWELWIRELLTQRAVFTEEVEEFIETTNRGKLDALMFGDAGKLKVKKQITHRAKKKLLSGLQVYLGNIYLPAYRFQEQPYVIKYVRRSYTEAEAIYKNWERWKYVRPGKADVDTPFGYRMNVVGDNDVEELHIMDPYNDEYSIIINGIPMMVNSTPLPWEVTADRRYNITMNVLKVVDTDFAYGKPLTASAKTLQALNNENIRLLIRKFRQAIDPPVAVTGKRIFSKDIFSAGSMVYGLKAKNIERLIEHNGVTQSEFNMFQLIEKKAEEFIGVGSLSQGIAESGEQTATEIQQLQINAAKNLGHAVAALIRAKRDATYQRLYNILENFTKPVSKTVDELTGKIQDVYQKFTIQNGFFADGKQGKKIIQFMDRPTTEEEDNDIFRFEEQEELAGRPIRIVPIDVNALRNIITFWYVTVNPKERDGSALSKVMFKDMIAQAQTVSQISGRPINGDKLVDDFEFKWQVKDIIQKTPPQTEQISEEAQGLDEEISNLERSKIGSQLTESVRAPMQIPSLNKVVSEVK